MSADSAIIPLAGLIVYALGHWTGRRSRTRLDDARSAFAEEALLDSLADLEMALRDLDLEAVPRELVVAADVRLARLLALTRAWRDSGDGP